MNENNFGFYGTLASDSDRITRDFLDSLLIEPRYIDSDLANTEFSLFGTKFKTPVMTAALSHLNSVCNNGMVEFALGAKNAGALNWVGMTENVELEAITATGAKCVKIIKPHSDNCEVFRKIEHAVKSGVFAVGMDIDHAFSNTGTYDSVFGLPMRPKTQQELSEFVKAASVPFIVKGVISVTDVQKCINCGVAGIVLSHHHNIMPCTVPPLMMLRQIRDVVGKDYPIFIDCGFISGADVFKALALGATGVCIGRGLMEPLKKGSAAVTEAINAITESLCAIMSRTNIRNLSAMTDKVLHKRTF